MGIFDRHSGEDDESSDDDEFSSDDEAPASENEVPTAILQPFIDQFRWTKPEASFENLNPEGIVDDLDEYENADPEVKKWKNGRFGFDFANALIKDDPLISFRLKIIESDFVKISLDHRLIAFFQEKGIELTEERKKQLAANRHWGLMLISIVPGILSIAHMISRFLVGLPGALCEWAERRVFPNFLPGRLLFYLLKQPFKWAETAISSTFQIINGAFLLIYSGCTLFSALWKKGASRREAINDAKQAFTSFVQKTGRALARLVLVGLIGAAGYFLAPIAVAALAGTLGTLGAACAVTGMGIVGFTVIQSVALSLKGKLSCRPGGGGNRGSTVQVLTSVQHQGTDRQDEIDMPPSPTSQPGPLKRKYSLGKQDSGSGFSSSPISSVGEKKGRRKWF